MTEEHQDKADTTDLDLPVELPTTDTSLTAMFYLTLTRRVEARYWAGFFAVTAGMLAYFHISPWAVEPPRDVMVPYTTPIFGYLAFGILLALIASTVVGSVYGAVLWYRNAVSPGTST